MDLLWLTSFNCQLFWALNWLCLVTVSHYVNSSVTFWNIFSNDSANSAYVDDLLRIVFIKAIIYMTIAYSWKDCGPSLVWSCRSYSKIYFNLLFGVCRRVPSGLQMLKGTGEREYDIKCLKSKGFLVFKLQEFNASRMFLFTSVTLTLPSFLVIWIFHMIWRNDLYKFFFSSAWSHISLETNRFCLKSSILVFFIAMYNK